MSGAKKVLLIIVAIVFVFSSNIFIISKSLQKGVSQDSFFENLLKEIDIKPILIQGLSLRLQEELVQEDVEEIQETLFSAIDESWIDDNLALVIEDVKSFLKGEKDNLESVLNFQEIKSSIMEETTLQERLDLSESLGLEGDILEMIPDEIYLAEILGDFEDNRETRNVFLTTVTRAYKILKIALYVVLAILAIIILLVAGLITGLKWLGISMAISGASIIVQISLLRGMVLSQEAVQSYNLLFQEMNKISLIYLASGLTLFVASIIIKKTRKKDEVQLQDS